MTAPHTTEPLPHDAAAGLRRALDGGQDVTVFVDGTVFRLPDGARDAVLDLLSRLAQGEAVTVSTVDGAAGAGQEEPGADELLNTGQAAALAGISHTFLRNMTDRGEIPVQYRGTHRRIRRGDILAWLAAQKTAVQKKSDAAAAADPAAD
ncbi:MULTISPECIES: helix-turn-helix domain-containing protein [Arthrobacter]|uniref:Helix-turn-helix domain-containing protein n=3 Tax=Arthrobacter TaxID=1663 RepID=A0ABU9KJE9_9MICC|nr:helix-turn-helix domain-containing protein [Arthrobacter sp. YJM1]MDP5226803.1 helix-turn-helix domain-containing protein [Arthrobacter sp. YJM1]